VATVRSLRAVSVDDHQSRFSLIRILAEEGEAAAIRRKRHGTIHLLDHFFRRAAKRGHLIKRKRRFGPGAFHVVNVVAVNRDDLVAFSLDGSYGGLRYNQARHK